MSLELITMILLAFSTIQVSKQQGIPNFYKHLSHTGKDLIVDYKVADNVSLTYAVCERRSNNSTHRNCVLKLETITGTSGRWQQKTCTLDLPKAKAKDTDYRKYKLVQIGNDYVLFAWKQLEGKRLRVRQHRSYVQRMRYFREFLKVRVIRMSDCEEREVGINAEDRSVHIADEQRISNLNVVTYENGSFSLFFRNYKFCRNNQRCSLIYDSATRTFDTSHHISLPVPYHAMAEILPITSANSTVRAYVVAVNFLEDGSIKLISLEGEILYDHPYSWSVLNIPLRASNIAVSNARENFGICQQGMFKSTIDCSMFDYEGKAKFNTSIALKSPYVLVTKMINAADGGFFLLIVYTADESKAIFQQFDILRINSDGTMGDVREMKNFSCPVIKSNFDVDFFERHGFDYCYYIACTWPLSEMDERNEFNLQFYSKCYPNEQEIDDV